MNPSHPKPPSRRDCLRGAAALLLAPATASWAAPADSRPLIDVWKDPNCGCCHSWVEHLERAGLRPRVHDTGNEAARARLGLPARLGSCHTALVAGYVVEGHVPAQEILRLLKERPRALGLAVPGMPVGSPGMDGPEYRGRRDPYDVLLVNADSSTRVYQSYR